MILGWPEGNGKVVYHAFRFCKKKQFGDAIDGIMEGAAGMSKELKYKEREKDKGKKKKKIDEEKDAIGGILKGAEGLSKQLKDKDNKKRKKRG